MARDDVMPTGTNAAVVTCTSRGSSSELGSFLEFLGRKDRRGGRSLGVDEAGIGRDLGTRDAIESPYRVAFEEHFRKLQIAILSYHRRGPES